MAPNISRIDNRIGKPAERISDVTTERRHGEDINNTAEVDYRGSILPDYRSTPRNFSLGIAGSGTSDSSRREPGGARSSLFMRFEVGEIHRFAMQAKFLKTSLGNPATGFFRRLYVGFDAINLLPSPLSVPLPLSLSPPPVLHSRSRRPPPRHEKLESTQALDKTSEREKGERPAKLPTCVRLRAQVSAIPIGATVSRRHQHHVPM